MTRICETCSLAFTPALPNRLNRFCSRACTGIYARSVNSKGLKDTAIDRFLEKVPSVVGDLCCEWTGNRDLNNYGVLSWFGRRTMAHRVAFQLVAGPISNKTFILHRCDNPPCVRFSHLFPGTQTDNVADMVAKKRNAWRSRPGITNIQAKLNEDDIRLIRSSPLSGAELARRLGVSKTAVNLVREGHTWRHLP
jgi:hypothetical protein